jgi:hypothetical protein
MLADTDTYYRYRYRLYRYSRLSVEPYRAVIQSLSDHLLCESDLYHHTKQSLARKSLSDPLLGENDPHPQNKQPRRPSVLLSRWGSQQEGEAGEWLFLFAGGNTCSSAFLHHVFSSSIILDHLSDVQLVHLLVGQLVNNEFQ